MRYCSSYCKSKYSNQCNFYSYPYYCSESQHPTWVNCINRIIVAVGVFVEGLRVGVAAGVGVCSVKSAGGAVVPAGTEVVHVRILIAVFAGIEHVCRMTASIGQHDAVGIVVINLGDLDLIGSILRLSQLSGRAVAVIEQVCYFSRRIAVIVGLGNDIVADGVGLIGIRRRRWAAADIRRCLGNLLNSLCIAGVVIRIDKVRR